MAYLHFVQAFHIFCLHALITPWVRIYSIKLVDFGLISVKCCLSAQLGSLFSRGQLSLHPACRVRCATNPRLAPLHSLSAWKSPAAALSLWRTLVTGVFLKLELPSCLLTNVAILSKWQNCFNYDVLHCHIATEFTQLHNHIQQGVFNPLPRV